MKSRKSIKRIKACRYLDALLTRNIWNTYRQQMSSFYLWSRIIMKRDIKGVRIIMSNGLNAVQQLKEKRLLTSKIIKQEYHDKRRS